MRQLLSWNRLLTMLATCLLAATAFAADGKFDHFATGFPLTGGHARVDCASCHVGGMFRGTPDRCIACHGPGGFVAGSTKPQNHILSSNRCEVCHTPARWNVGTRTDHSAVTGSCISCHNGQKSPGKTRNHVISSNECGVCHNTVSWRNARYDHTGITSPCLNCHNGKTAPGKTRNHVTSSNLCGDCHSTRAWKPAGFDHAGIAAGTCTTCHNGVNATGKSARHFVTSRQCDSCHNKTNWATIRYSHTGYYRSHSGLTCTSCHKGNREAITGFSWWATYPRTCAGCHAGDYEADEHDKSLSVNRNCGSCHSTRTWDR